MNAKKAKSKVGKSSEAEQPKGRPEIMKPSGHVPAPIVISRHRLGKIERPGKGFSKGELGAVALPSGMAAGWGLRMDLRRRSVVEANVQGLKKWFSPPAIKAAPAPASAGKKPRKRTTKKKKA